MNPPLKRLDPSNGPVRHHGRTSDLVIRLQLLNLPKEKVNLVHPVGVLPSGSPRGIPRNVVMSRDSPRSERDGARNTRI